MVPNLGASKLTCSRGSERRSQIPAGRRVGVGMTLTLASVTFLTFGTYSIVITWDGNEVRERPITLFVTRLTVPARGAVGRAVRPSRHAAARTAERNISLEDVSSVLDDPDVTFRDVKGNPCDIRGIGGRRIKVVAADHEDLVVTVIALDD